MRTTLTSFVLLLAIAGPLVTPASAASCRRTCRKAIVRCVKDACARFSGPVRAGCKRGLRITILGACKVAGDRAQVCAEIERDGCEG